jgi:hypothetical protein
MSVVADFGTLFSIEDYRITIADKLKNLDVAVLVINAGFNKNKIWMDISELDL